MTSRRGFLGSILALGAAPSIVKASSIMKVAQPIWMPGDDYVATHSVLAGGGPGKEGLFTLYHEVSNDGVTWVTAKKLERGEGWHKTHANIKPVPGFMFSRGKFYVSANGSNISLPKNSWIFR